MGLNPDFNFGANILLLQRGKIPVIMSYRIREFRSIVQEVDMNRIMEGLVIGLFSGLSVWTAQALGAPYWAIAVSAAVGGFLGVWIGQMVSGKS
ncbi:hypothetical protein RU07_22930 [Agrobacterium tumefaciens]|uniref:Uncharacterized protein n=1 Tax=Agrobacterium tumefaciens TaxID=358 RepID=A0A0D0JRT4_AGRTU|nr:hypothetical protein RU07_22930 [Agrobacterium tumefaciens]